MQMRDLRIAYGWASPKHAASSKPRSREPNRYAIGKYALGTLCTSREVASPAAVGGRCRRPLDPIPKENCHEFETHRTDHQKEGHAHFRGPRDRGGAFAGERLCGYLQPARGRGPHRCKPEERAARCRALIGNAERGSRLPDVADVWSWARGGAGG